MKSTLYFVILLCVNFAWHSWRQVLGLSRHLHSHHAAKADTPSVGTIRRVHQSANATAAVEKPHKTNSTVFIMVLTRREALERRRVIRETWAAGHDNVYFILGKACSIPPAFRKDTYSCKAKKKTLNLQQFEEMQKVWMAHQNKETELDAQIAQEMRTYQDIILEETLVDSYRSLPAKLKVAYRWAVSNLPQAKWFVKADDDMFLKVEKLVDSFRPNSRGVYKELKTPPIHQGDLPKRLDPTKDNIMAGGYLVKNQLVPRDANHKWVESDHYKNATYPFFFGGDGGHVISRAFAQYIAHENHRLFEYQGEDVSMGIWAQEAPMQVILLRHARFDNSKNCDPAKTAHRYLIGHKMDNAQLQKCWEQQQQQQQQQQEHEQQS